MSIAWLCGQLGMNVAEGRTASGPEPFTFCHWACKEAFYAGAGKGGKGFFHRREASLMV